MPSKAKFGWLGRGSGAGTMGRREGNVSKGTVGGLAGSSGHSVKPVWRQ